MNAYTKKEGYFTVKYLHESSNCSSCTNSVEYYKLRDEVISDTENYEQNKGDLCGMISFLMYMEGKVLDGSHATLAEYNLIKKQNKKLLDCDRFQHIRLLLGFQSSELYHRLNALFIKFKNYETVHKHVKEECLNALENCQKRTLCSTSKTESANLPNNVKDSPPSIANSNSREETRKSNFSVSVLQKKKASPNSVKVARALKKNYLSLPKNYNKKQFAVKKAVPKSYTNKNAVSDFKKKASKAHRKIKKTKNLDSSLPTCDKLPAKGTLKRKRWFLEKLETTESYEDDIFEKRDLYIFQNLVEDTSDDVHDIATPTWTTSLSPERERSNSPTFEDCYNQQELLHSRKEAVHYLFRRQKRKFKLTPKDKSRSASKSKEPEHTMTGVDTAHQLQEACKVLSRLKDELALEDGDEEDDDYYFSDIEDL